MIKNAFATVLLTGCIPVLAQQQDLSSLPQASIADWPDWAYGYSESVVETDPEVYQVPHCAPDANPRSCGPVGTALPDDGVKLSLPGTSLTFTRAEANYSWQPADWYPGDHPKMPEIVAVGDRERGIRPCALCHFPNGQGKIENGHVAGLPKTYILQQLALFEIGERVSADYRKANTNEMARIAANLSTKEKDAAADYFAAIPFRSMVRVVESEQAPQVRASLNRLLMAVEDAPWQAIDKRIVEVAEDAEATERMRDPRGGFVAYVPVGSIAKGRALVTTGADKTIQCALCHGAGQRGMADVPSIAGRTASYTMRQLWDVKQGARVSPLMAAVVANLSAEDMMCIAAYLATLPPGF